MTGRASPTSLGYLLKETVLFLGVCYFLLFANNWYTLVDYNVVRLGVSLLAILSVTWLALSLWPGQGAPVSTPLTLPLLLFLAVYLLTALTSIDPRRSLDEVWTAGAYVLGFVLTAELVSRGWPRELFVKVLLIVGSVVVGLFWREALAWYGGWLEAAPGHWLPDIAYHLPFASGIAIFLNLLLMPALARLLVTRALLPRILLALWSVAALGLLFLTSSRGGWFGLLMGVGTLVALSVRDAGGRAYLRGLSATIQQRWRFSLAVLAVGMAALIVIVRAAVQQVVYPDKAPTLQLARSGVWVPAWETFQRSPWVGQGPLTFGSSYLRANSVPPNPFYPHAHSVLFNLLAETGLAGVAAFGLLALSAFFALWRQASRLKGEERAVAVGVLAAVMTFAANSAVDMVNFEPFNSFTIAVLLGATLAGVSRAEELIPARPRSRVPAYLLARWPIALGLLLSATGIYRAWRLAPLHSGIQAANGTRWAEAAAYLAEAVRRDPHSTIAQQQLGLANGVLAARGDPGALEQAITALEEAARLDPAWWLHHANLGVLYTAHGDKALALRALQMAAALAPSAAIAHLNLGAVAEDDGAWAVAGQAYTATLNLRPDWVNAYFWRATLFRARVSAEWRAGAPRAQPPTLAELETAVTQGADRASVYIELSEADLNLGRLQEAGLLLRKADLAYYASGEERLEALWLKAEIAAAQSDWPSAIASGEQALEGYRQQSVLGPGTFGTTAYGPHLFRQETMAVDLTPQLLLAPFTDRWVQRLVRLGTWHAAAGHPAQAAGLYQEALTLAPDNAEAAERLRP